LQTAERIAGSIRQNGCAGVEYFEVQLHSRERLTGAGVQVAGNSRPLPLQFTKDRVSPGKSRGITTCIYRRSEHGICL
jgi:hypothetical protein